MQIRYTNNLTANLQGIEAFWDECQFPNGFDRLVNELSEPVIANLKRHPRLGRNFLQRQTKSIETQARLQKLDALLSTLNTDIKAAEIREYVMTDYLLLYALVSDVIYLLAIKRQKQLSFALDDVLSET
ncbi:MAG: type II toxin-antitoxin system RelE/ParE family toxin [Rhodoferax sp.]|uniref:type II toxin-antitoxin system RelE/ParE family toxin n=1 Tax=Rhodoferax sp. TaxID=50421 RepID=UPI0017AADFC6|nr:type II toxin-antitoxin system RelE/ParE family toxin [Rhodoferax sp.]NMM12901.1 type II toxin-antitoxin system RelE/ParE family toxin [Rhodoferax sp.]